MSIEAAFLAEIEAFLTISGMPATTLGALALNDPSFVSRVRAGRKVRLDTADRLRSYMARYKERAA